MPSSAITDFVASCRNFSAGSLDPEDVRTLRRVTERDMPEHYRIPYPEPTVVRSGPDAKEHRRHLRGLWHELVQHLRDLRYLSEAAFIGYHQHKHQVLERPAFLVPVAEAVARYVAEEREWPELAEILPPGSPPDLLWLSRHLAVVVDRIGLHTSWDGSALVPASYRVGEKTAFGRAFAYRLRTLSSAQFAFASEIYYDGTDRPALNELFAVGFSVRGTASTTGIPRGYWTALGNIDSLLVSYVNNAEKRADLALLYQLPAGRDTPQTALAALTDDDLGFMNADWDQYHKATARKIIRKARRRGEREDDGLDVRLLQVKLWQAGYYTGAVDGEWGKISHRALSTFLQDEAQLIIDERRERRPNSTNVPERARRIRSYLVPANRAHRVYAADLKAVIKLLGVEVRRTATDLELAQPAGQKGGRDTLKELPKRADVTTEVFDARVLREDEIGRLYPNNVSKPKRRVSFFRRVTISLVGGFRKVARWLKQGVRKIAELLGPVFSFVKTLLRPIRAAIHRFFQGFRYLANFVLGKPLITETAPATDTTPARYFGTKFKLDFDSVNFAPADCSAAEAVLHGAHINRMRRDMGYFIDSVIWIVRAIGRLTSPGGWVWLGWQVVKALFRKAKPREASVVVA